MLEDLEAKLEALQTQVADASSSVSRMSRRKKCLLIWLLQSGAGASL